MSTMCGISTTNNWDAEIKEMNQGKVGEPFHYPNTFLLLLGYAKAYFYLPYRQTKGITQDHAKGKYHPFQFTTINRRINKLKINMKEDDNKNKDFKDEYIVIAIDITGIKFTNRGQWMRDKWNDLKWRHVTSIIKKKDCSSKNKCHRLLCCFLF